LLFITHSFTNSIQRPSSRSKRQAIEVEKTEHDGLSGEPGEAEQEGSGEPEVAKKGGGVSLGKILGNFKVLLPKYRAHNGKEGTFQSNISLHLTIKHLYNF
jgi:hypothetical protein